MEASKKVCPFCEGIFAADKIKDHIGKVHLGILPEFSDQGNDLNQKDSKNDFNCEICAKSFLSPTSLEKHKNFVHSQKITNSPKGKRNKRWKCDQCEKSYFQKTKLKYHIQTIHKGLRYQCDKCEKSFTTKGRLKSHDNIIHLGIKISCDDCDKSFAMLHTSQP